MYFLSFGACDDFVRRKGPWAESTASRSRGRMGDGSYDDAEQLSFPTNVRDKIQDCQTELIIVACPYGLRRIPRFTEQRSPNVTPIPRNENQWDGFE